MRSSSAHPLASPSAACFLLVGSSARPRLVSPGSPPHSTSETGRHEIGGRMAGVVMAACLPRMATGRGRSSTADGCGRRVLAWLFACLGAMDGAARSFLDRFSFPIIVSSNRFGPVSFHHLIASSHRLISSTGRNLLFLSARPPPACSSRSACLGLFPRPRPGDVRAAAWLAAGGRPVCLRFHLSCRSLADARSLVAIRSVSIVPLVPSWGVVGRFMGYSTRYLVGVGIFKYMPLNRILWLLTGIFGDGVRCLFSALPVATVSPVCPALRPSFGCGVMALVRACLCCELGETARVRSLIIGAFSASCVMG